MYLLPLLIPLALVKFASATGEATLLDCRGARKDTIKNGSLDDLIKSLDDMRSKVTWSGGELATDRHIWTSRSMWNSVTDAYNHCVDACLLPAASYGFDAAYCRVSAQSLIHAGVGYSPSTKYMCKEYAFDGFSARCWSYFWRRMYPTASWEVDNCVNAGSLEGACPDDMTFHFQTWDETKSSWALQDETGEFADLHDSWMLATMGFWVPRDNRPRFIGLTAFPKVNPDVQLPNKSRNVEK